MHHPLFVQLPESEQDGPHHAQVVQHTPHHRGQVGQQPRRALGQALKEQCHVVVEVGEQLDRCKDQ